MEKKLFTMWGPPCRPSQKDDHRHEGIFGNIEEIRKANSN